MSDEAPSPEEIARAHGIPWPLMRASFEPSQYALGIRGSDDFWVFKSCDFDLDYVFVWLRDIIEVIDLPYTQARQYFTYRVPCKNGIVLRIVDILWISDDPCGIRTNLNFVGVVK